jgi:hypothetical protein
MSFCLRLKNSDSIIKEVSTQVRLHPVAVSHVPQALPYLVTTETLLSDAPEVGASVVMGCQLIVNLNTCIDFASGKFVDLMLDQFSRFTCSQLFYA